MLSTFNLGQLFFLMNPRRKNQGLILVFMTILGSLIEVVSLTAVFPILAYILDPAAASDGYIMQRVRPLLDLLPFEESFSLGFLFTCVVLISSFYRIILTWLQVSWGNAVGHDFSVMVFSKLIKQDYEQHIVRNTSDIVAGITVKINQLVGSYINPLVAICSSIVLLLAIVFTLVLTAGYQVGLAIALIGLIYSLITFLIKSKLASNSFVISKNANTIVQQVQESFQGVREVKLNATEELRINSFSAMDKELRAAQSSSTVLSQAPRYIVESLLVVLMIGTALFFAGKLSLSGDILPIIGVVALGIQRTMPLAQTIYVNVATMKGAVFSVKDVFSLASVDAKCHHGTTKDGIFFEKKIDLKGIFYRYPKSNQDQIKDITVSINKGDWVGIYGKTGSGKSTLLDLICGLLEPTSGTILIDDIDLSSLNHSDWINKLAVVSQSAYFSDATIWENITLNEKTPNLDRLNNCLKISQLKETIDALKDGINTRIGEAGVQLSGGQLQRLSIARALYRNAEILIFDEATSALDYQTENDLMGALRESDSNLTVIMVAHRIKTLESCNLLIEINKGQVASVTPQLNSEISTKARY